MDSLACEDADSEGYIQIFLTHRHLYPHDCELDRQYDGRATAIYIYRQIIGDLYHADLLNWMIQACNYIYFTTFNLAHWLFAFSYLVLSYRIELTMKGLPEDTHNFTFNSVNILVCTFSGVVPGIFWIYNVKEEYKARDIAGEVG